MNGKHYSHGKRGMLISEAMLQIMLSDFSKESNEKQQNFQQLYQQVETLQNIIVNNFEIDDLVEEELDKCEQLSDEYVTSLNEFISQGNRMSHLFIYWSIFLINVVIILRDFTMYFRQANWFKHVLALGRAIPLFYIFDRITKDGLPYTTKIVQLYRTNFQNCTRLFVKGILLSLRHSIKVVVSHQIKLQKCNIINLQKASQGLQVLPERKKH